MTVRREAAMPPREYAATSAWQYGTVPPRYGMIELSRWQTIALPRRCVTTPACQHPSEPLRGRVATPLHHCDKSSPRWQTDASQRRCSTTSQLRISYLPPFFGSLVFPFSVFPFTRSLVFPIYCSFSPVCSRSLFLSFSCSTAPSRHRAAMTQCFSVYAIVPWIPPPNRSSPLPFGALINLDFETVSKNLNLRNLFIV